MNLPNSIQYWFVDLLSSNDNPEKSCPWRCIWKALPFLPLSITSIIISTISLCFLLGNTERGGQYSACYTLHHHLITDILPASCCWMKTPIRRLCPTISPTLKSMINWITISAKRTARWTNFSSCTLSPWCVVMHAIRYIGGCDVVTYA